MGEEFLLAANREDGGWVLEELDEYSLYCHYLGFQPELGQRYLSPLRLEHRPSFNIFESKKYPDREYFWKDNGVGLSGDVFALVQRMYGYATKREAITRICQEFGLEHCGAEVLQSEKILPVTLQTQPRPNPSQEIEIRILSREWLRTDLDYWTSQGISLKTLQQYRVSPVRCYWMVKHAQNPTTALPGTYTYRNNLHGKILYKLYRPAPTKPERSWFRTNFTDEIIEGYEQLDPEGALLVITKSTKECMWLRQNLGVNAVAGRSETTYLTDAQIEHLYGRFETLVSFMDYDPAGLASAAHYETYSIPAVFLPEAGPKDITDYTKAHGLEAAIRIARPLITAYDH